MVRVVVLRQKIAEFRGRKSGKGMGSPADQWLIRHSFHRTCAMSGMQRGIDVSGDEKWLGAQGTVEDKEGLPGLNNDGSEPAAFPSFRASRPVDLGVGRGKEIEATLGSRNCGYVPAGSQNPMSLGSVAQQVVEKMLGWEQQTRLNLYWTWEMTTEFSKGTERILNGLVNGASDVNISVWISNLVLVQPPIEEKMPSVTVGGKSKDEFHAHASGSNVGSPLTAMWAREVHQGTTPRKLPGQYPV
ncbi:hypothetical protein DFP72DRAFT_858298 [Ephemerocybe angulata]|uniref:Uncharacterized protein n=1 Tax=Ephemerocybe angulata TaxID=980116 RepID=A0A8H6HDM8_9AGAR|nr:hypothetical protein DFP72DRAFT_858298 [Tulosesus angulatus]